MPGASRADSLRDRAAAARAQGDRALAWGRVKVPGCDATVEALEYERASGGGLIAGGLAYRLFFWLVPLGLVFAALLSFWVEEDQEGLEDAARELGLGAVAAHSAVEAVSGESHSRWYFLVVGLVLVGWFSLGVVRALLVAHALAWQTGVRKLRRPLAAAALFTGLAVTLLFVSVAAAWLREQSPGPGIGVTLALIVVYASIALWVMTLLPHADAPWRALVPGALLVAVGTQAIHLTVALYLAPRLGRSSELYGSLGVATVILLWLYLTARLITGAAFLNASLWDRRRRG